MGPDRELWRHIRQALSDSNALPTGGFQKELVISTAVVALVRHGESEFALDARIPRSALNELGMTKRWDTGSRSDAAAFLRELADLIEGK